MLRLIIRNTPLFAMLVAFALTSAAPATAELPVPKTGADGMYTEPWFKASTYDMRKDLAAAKADGKILAVIWEQVGCSYCQKMHMVHFRNEVMVDFIKKNFYVVKLDMRGDRPTTDFDGTAMSEAEMARRHAVNGTPNIEFRNADGNEAFRMPGYAEPLIFYGVLDYVVSGGYKTASLGDWLSQRFADGTDPLAGG